MTNVIPAFVDGKLIPNIYLEIPGFKFFKWDEAKDKAILLTAEKVDITVKNGSEPTRITKTRQSVISETCIEFVAFFIQEYPEASTSLVPAEILAAIRRASAVRGSALREVQANRSRHDEAGEEEEAPKPVRKAKPQNAWVEQPEEEAEIEKPAWLVNGLKKQETKETDNDQEF